MKYTLLLLSLLSVGNTVWAQEHHAADYDISVYENFKDLPRSKRINWSVNKSIVNAQFPNWYVFSDKLSGQFTDITGEAIALPGNTIEAKISYCFNNQLKSFGIQKQEWVLGKNTDAGFAKFANYKQHINGHEVVFSKLSFRFTKDEKLVRIQHKSFGTPMPATPVLTIADALAAAKSDLKAIRIDYASIDPNWVWFPVPNNNGYELKPSWAFTIYGHDEYLPVELTGYVDGTTGEILYRNNGVHETVDLTVTGSVYKQNPLVPASTEPLADLQVKIGLDTFYTDATGYFSDAVLSTPISATLNLEGRWSRVYDRFVTGTIPSYTHLINATGTTTLFDTSASKSFNDRLVNAYYHVGRVHNHMKNYLPSFIGLDNPLTTNVDVTSGTCNAFYTGSQGGSINFYAASGNCNSMAYCGDIIYHEYGHGINHRFYQSQGAGSMDNGAMNEGYADIWGIGITGDVVLGKGAFANGSIIRRYDQSPKVYPQDLVGQVHADGEIIAGSWVDVYQNIGSMDTMLQIFTKSYFDVVDGPDGTEGDVYHAVLISALENDDDDGNITNGTPHFMQIITAFARHGIYLLQDAEIIHEDIPNQPVGQPITLNASVTLTQPSFFQGIKVFYKDRFAPNWDSLAMTNSGGSNYTATLPGYSNATIVDYYFAVYDIFTLLNKRAPVNYVPGAPVNSNNIIYQFGVGLNKVSGEDFEGTIDTAWQIGLSTDNASASGRWIVASPVASTANGLPVQTGVDNTTKTAAGKCLVTGNASPTAPAGQADVDNGITTAITPVYNLSGFTDPVVEYFRWYGNDRGSNRGNDYWEAYITADPTGIGGNIAIDYTNKSDYSWRRRMFFVKEIFTTIPSSIRLKFVASDKIVSGQQNNGQSTVEAAVDDIFIYENATPNSVRDIHVARADVYPNPANQEINIKFGSQPKGALSLTDITGKELLKIEMTGTRSEYVFPTSSLVNGTYLVVIHLGNSIQTSKVSVSH